MKGDIERKKKQLKDQFRKNYIDSYRNQIRQSIINNRMKDQDIKELNQKITQFIHENNLEELYKYLFKGSNKSDKEVPMAHLSSENILYLLDYLMKNLFNLKAVLLLNNLFDIHYSFIFLTPNHEEKSIIIVKILYEQFNIVIAEYAHECQNDPRVRQLGNGLINCLKSLIFSKDETGSNGYRFTQAVKAQYIVNYLFKWLETLIQNPIFLMMMVIMEFDMNISQIEIIKLSLNNSSKMMIRLLEQSNPNNIIFKSCSIPSLSLALSFLKKIKNKKTLEQLVYPLLQTSKVVYSLSNKANFEFYKIRTFHQTIVGVIYVFSELEKINMKKSLCDKMKDANFWVFVTILLRNEAFIIRQSVLDIVRLAFSNLLVCKGNLDEYLSESLIGLLGEGLEMNVVEIILHCLRIFVDILELCRWEHVDQAEKYLKWIDQFDIDTGLENLEHSPNKEIAELSQLLLEKKRIIQSNFKGDMEEQQNTRADKSL